MPRALVPGLLCCVCLLGGVRPARAEAASPRAGRATLSRTSLGQASLSQASLLAVTRSGGAHLPQTVVLRGRGLPEHGWVRVRLFSSGRSLTVVVKADSAVRLRVLLKPRLRALLHRRHGRLLPTRVWLELAAERASGASRARAVSFVIAPTRRTRALATHAASARRASADMGLFEDLQYMTGAALQTRLDQYQAIGAKWARFQMIWSNVQSGGPGSYDWQPYDELIAGLVARGIQPLVVIDTTPSWARPAHCSEQPTCAPADPARICTVRRGRGRALPRRGTSLGDLERAQQRGLLEARARGRRLYGAVEAHICGDQGRRPRCGGDHRGYRT